MGKKRVVLFRASKSPLDPYDQVLKEAGYEPHFVEVLQFQFINQELLSASLLDSSPFSGLIFTSQTAVEAITASLSAVPDASRPSEEEKAEEEKDGGASSRGKPGWKHALVEQWQSMPIFVVSKATAQADFKQRDNPLPLLFPCSSIRRDTLPSALREAGLALREVPCYNTKPHPDIARNLHQCCERQPCDGDVVCAVFFSPSGVEFALQDLLRVFGHKGKIKLVAIGKTCAEALANAGHPPSGIAAAPTPQALLDTIDLLT